VLAATAAATAQRVDRQTPTSLADAISDVRVSIFLNVCTKLRFPHNLAGSI